MTTVLQFCAGFDILVPVKGVANTFEPLAMHLHISALPEKERGEFCGADWSYIDGLRRK